MSFERKKYNMDLDWRFSKNVDHEKEASKHSEIYTKTKTGNAVGPATKRAYDDSEWECVNLPHDYMRESELSSDALGTHGYRVFCDGWYRKTFTVDSALRGKHALLVFEGIATSSVIYLNGSVVARSHTSYNEIIIDVTDRLYYDRINTLAVFTKGDDIEGWWYEGAGIYRHVYLFIKENVHIAHHGIYAKPILVNEAEELWNVELEVTLENSDYQQTHTSVHAMLYDGETLISDSTEEVMCIADGRTVVKTDMSVLKPVRWDVECPKLYTVKVEVLKEGEVLDSDSVRTGFRTFKITPDRGFFLNERPIKIKGTGNHQDHAGVGIGVPDSIQFYRIKRLKEMGCNAYRCAHNPHAKEILDACDEMGLIVMDENRTFETRPDAIKDLENLILRDRNHPSIMFYSLYNEEPLQNSSEGEQIFKRLKSCVRKLDNTRLILGATNDAPTKVGTGLEMDVFGINYGLRKLETIHNEYPDLPIIGAEACSATTSRGCYKSDREVERVLSNYDEEKVPWGHTIRENWKAVRDNDFFAGTFIWTGFDHYGEPIPFVWPSTSCQFGVMDRCGFPKGAYYFTKAVFDEKPMIQILPHWNHTEGEMVRVMTVTNCDEVELFLNGKSLGRRESDPCEQCEWKVVFEAGTIAAVGYQNGEKVAYTENKTAGKAIAVKLTPDRAYIDNCGQDTVPVRVSLVDENGIEVPTANNLIEFEIEGDGVIAGVGNGDPNSHEADYVPYRKLYCGLCQVLVTAKYDAKSLKLIAHCEGMQTAQFDFEIKENKSSDYIFFTINQEITGIQASITDNEEKPDPAHIYSDDDMNSLAPLVLETAFYGFVPAGFVSGWREFRIPVVLPNNVPEGKIPALEIQSIICDTAEFYVDGELIFAAQPDFRAALTVPCDITDRKEFEVRALVKANESVSVGSGFGMGITLSMIER